jgi:hypothetical protein
MNIKHVQSNSSFTPGRITSSFQILPLTRQHNQVISTMCSFLPPAILTDRGFSTRFLAIL